MPQRTIELDLLTDNVSNAEQLAIAYLSVWALGSYPFVRIAQERNGGLCAAYRKTKDTHCHPDYFIAGIFDAEKGTYSFHS